MSMEKLIQELVDQAVFDQQEKLLKGLEASKQKFEENIKTIKQFNAQLKNPGSSYGALQIIKEIDKANKDLEVSHKKLLAIQAENNKLQMQANKLKLQEEAIAKKQSERLVNEAKARTLNAQAAKREASAVETAHKAKMRETNAKLASRSVSEIPLEINKPASDTVSETFNIDNRAEIDAATESLLNRSQAVTQVTRATTVYNSELEKLTGTINENERYLAILKNELDDVAAKKKQAKGNTAELVAEETNLRREIKDTTAMIKLQQKELASEAGSLDQLNARLRQTEIAYERLGEEAKKSAVGKTLLKDANDLRGVIAEQESNLGRHTKSIQKNTNLMVRAFNGAYTGLRKIAYLIPGLGIAGIMSLLAGGIVDVIKASDLFTKQLTDQQKATNLTNEINSKAIDGYVEQKVQMESLIDRAQKHGKTKREEAKILSDYNKTFGDTIGKAKTYAEAEQYIIDKGPAFIQAITLRAKAMASMQIAVEESRKALEAEMNGTEAQLDWMDRISLNMNRKFAKWAKEGTQFYKDAMSGVKFFNQKAYDAQQKIIKDANEKASAALKQNEQFTNEADALAKRSNFNFDKQVEQRQRSQDRAIENEREAQEKLLELRKEAALRANELDYDMYKNSAFTDNDVALAERAAAKIYDIEKRWEERIRDKKLEERKLTAAQIELIHAEHEDKLFQLSVEFLGRVHDARENAAERFKRMEEEISEAVRQEQENRYKTTLENAEREANALKDQVDLQGNSELLSLSRQYKEGTLDKEEYERKKFEIEQKYALKTMQLQAKVFLAMAQNMNLDAEARADYYKKYEEMIKAISKFEIQQNEETTEVTQEERKKRWDATLQTLNYIQNQLADIVNADFEANMAALDNKKRLIDESFEKEMKAIEETTMAEAEKQERIKILEAQQAEARKQLEIEEREMKRRKANWDRALAVTNIIQSTAQAVAVALTAGPYIGVVLAAVVGALGAVQLAKVMSQPIPQYKQGRKGGPAEIALVGEAGSERINYPDGQSEYVHSPTIKYLPAGASVISNAELLNEKRLNNGVLSEKYYVNSSGELKDMSFEYLREDLDKLLKAVKDSKTSFHIHRSWMGDYVSMEQNNRFQKWINDNV